MRKLATENTITPPVLSLRESARYLAVSRATLYVLLSDGRLPSIKLGKRRLIRVRDLDALIDQAGKAA